MSRVDVCVGLNVFVCDARVMLSEDVAVMDCQACKVDGGSFYSPRLMGIEGAWDLQVTAIAAY